MATRRRAVVWTLAAYRGLEDVLAYVALDSPEAAHRIVQRVVEAAESLGALSQRGRMVPEFRDPMIRETFIFGYRLLYEVGDNEVSIIAFLHGARDFERWRRNEN